MATVRISKALLVQVETHIKGMQQSTHTATIAPHNPTLKTDFKDRLVFISMRKLWAGFEHLKDIVPASWLKDVTRLDIQVAGVPEQRIDGRFFLPPNTPRSGFGYAEVSLEEDDVLEEDVHMFTELRHFRSLEVANADKFDRAERTALNFLKSCKSVNDAIKKYPDIVLYLPQYVLKDIDKVVTRSTRESAAVHETVALDEEERKALTATGVVGALFV